MTGALGRETRLHRVILFFALLNANRVSILFFILVHELLVLFCEVNCVRTYRLDFGGCVVKI